MRMYKFDIGYPDRPGSWRCQVFVSPSGHCTIDGYRVSRREAAKFLWQHRWDLTKSGIIRV